MLTTLEHSLQDTARPRFPLIFHLLGIFSIINLFPVLAISIIATVVCMDYCVRITKCFLDLFNLMS